MTTLEHLEAAEVVRQKRREAELKAWAKEHRFAERITEAMAGMGYVPVEPPDDYRIFNRRQPDGTFRPLSSFFDSVTGEESEAAQ